MKDTIPMFNLSEFSKSVREAFTKSSNFWPTCIDEAIKSGVRDADKLTNLAFYMQHKDRMHGDFGKPIARTDPRYQRLSAEWKSFRNVITPLVPQEPMLGGS
ncbi:hypothetical protein [Pseudaestuariivita rosea]|uniref:hypothetical protein n=1 Tax=Pseudaestuariivita rosea TaxID=2763263 RepID=UPI001ABB153A|nr:hypothetical protein [Pseudaestuariivita rosea]